MKVAPLSHSALCLLLLNVLLSCGTIPSMAHPQSVDEHYGKGPVRYEDRTYVPNIRTVQLYKTGLPLSLPITELRSPEGLELHFDDLQPYAENYSYTLVLCDARWEPSDLMSGQYLVGAMTDYLPPGRLSFNTLQPYFHYSLQVPNDMMQVSRSGNYILKVFRGSDQDDVVLTRRFMVYETKVRIDAGVTASRNVELRNSAQQVDLVVQHPELQVNDPFSDIEVLVLQNGNWNTARPGMRPRFVRGTELIYDHPDQGLFPGNNEWRNFDVKDLRFKHQQVARIMNGPQLTEVFLFPDEKRNIRTFFDRPDINGRYLIGTALDDNAFLGADYVNVHFTLPMDDRMAGGGVYVFGGLSDMQCRRETRMNWDEERKLYHQTLLLKQGFYDYAYAFLPDGSNTADLTRLEGSHFQADNEYLVLVYYMDYQQRSQRLVGMRVLNSRGG